MTIFLITFVLMVLVIAGMSVGVLFGRGAIKGSCGGMNNGSCPCVKKCDKRRSMERAKSELTIKS